MGTTVVTLQDAASVHGLLGVLVASMQGVNFSVSPHPFVGRRNPGVGPGLAFAVLVGVQ